MKKVLRRRLPREIRENFFRYASLFLMITLCMYIVIALVDAAEIIIVGTQKNQADSHLEDGQFTVFYPLQDEQLDQIERAGVTVEKHFSYDINVDDGSTLRIFKNREKIDLVVLDKYGVNNQIENYGTDPCLAGGKNEVVLEKRYCDVHDISVGDTIRIGEENYFVTGIGSSVDYDAPYRKLSDTAVDSKTFGTAFVADEEYERIKDNNSVGTEEFTYAFLLNDAMSEDDLKQMIRDFDFDYKKVDDPYYQEILSDTYGKRDKITDGIDDLVDGVEELYDGSRELTDGTEELKEGMNDLCDGSVRLRDGTVALDDALRMAGLSCGSEKVRATAADLAEGIRKAEEGSEELDDGACELFDGVEELRDGVADLKDQSDEMMEKLFKESPDNIMEFMLREDNLRIGGAAGDIEINKLVGVVAGIIVIVLFTYVLSVFVIHQIQSESSVIGALYALGVKKKDLMVHYITLPTVISFLGGLTGAIFGFSGLGSSWQMSDSYEYYSLPWFGRVIPAYLIVYAIVMPPVVSLIVNFLVIRRSLSRTALSLIRNEQKVSRGKDIKLGDMPFMRKFSIRQMLRERRTAFTIIVGMMIALLIFVMGMDCYVLCESVGRLSSEDTGYEYMYSYKYPTKEVPKTGEAAYVETLKKERFGYTLDITVMGIDTDNPYINVKPVKGKNKIVASDAVALRYGLKTGDKLVLTDNSDDIDYAFTIADVAPYSVGLTVFMDIDSMRKLFGQEDDYYNVVMSDHALSIEPGRLYSVTSRSDVVRSSDIFLDLMRPLFTMLITMSVVIFCIVMYLMTTVMIDRAQFGISLVKIFGYKTRDVKKLYLNGNRTVVIIGALIGIPTAKLLMDAVFPMFVANVACTVHLEYRWYHYVIIFAGILLCYQIISMMLTAKLGRITPAEVLKNRE
ncbi:MAG: FtsX-like permease family protein [Lachnospiraceae bacterium]|nr:FtsX-like permease family protein [Lachnospiraceae bacterium]